MNHSIFYSLFQPSGANGENNLLPDGGAYGTEAADDDWVLLPEDVEDEEASSG